VYNYLAGQAKDLSSYATSPIWSIVDGPWKLSAFNADGHVTFAPNKSYSGPVKPKLAAFQEVPFTTDTAEYNVLQSPSSSTKVDVGYIPAADLPAKPPGAAAGANPLAAKGYTLAPLYAWGMGFYVMNLNSTTGNGPVIRQLYFRQAMAYLMDQQGVVNGPLRGYGSVTVGPVGNVPVTKFLSPKGRQGDPFPFSIAKAKALLTGHGWTVVPGGSTSCADPANYGGYSSAVNDAMIEKTLLSPNLSYMYTWQDFLATQLPFEWQPFPAYQLTEVANSLKGVTPQSSTLSITPETWYFVK